MSSDRQRDVACPRCGYNLRGLKTPRCPECGFAFDFEQFEAGALRENVASRLDGCDLWQPHQILLGSLSGLARGVLHPRWLLGKLDINGPLAAAGVMLVGGLLWVWLLTGVLAAVALGLHTGASPAAALRAGLLIWGARLLLPSMVVSLGLIGPGLSGSIPGLARPTRRQRARLGAYLLPVFAAYGCAPFAIGLCLAPELVLGMHCAWMVLPFLLWIMVARRELGGPAATASRAASVLGANAIGVAVGLLLAQHLLPDTLDLPTWIYLP